MPLRLPVPTADAVLAVGPHLKNTFTLAQGEDAYVSQHVGDLENLETLAHFQDALTRLESLFRIEPEWVVRDLHPGYLSTRLAEESGLLELPAVQHHHAHIAAVMGEHAVTGKVLGLAFDGTGYGPDGLTWGFEILEADLRGFERLAHQRYAPLPGGDKAARTPWRALFGYASLEGSGGPWARSALSRVPVHELSVTHHQIRRHINSPLASSMGRLFDAAAAALGLRLASEYEGQAAMELEAIAGALEAEPLPFPVVEGEDGCAVFDPVPLLAALAHERGRGAPCEDLAAGFHEAIVESVGRLALKLCDERGLDRVAMGGGCFQNARLLSSLKRRLQDGGAQVLTPMVLGPNDGAVSYGQAVVAAARMND